MRRVSEELIDFAGLQVTRSGKWTCNSCRHQKERQAMVSVPLEYLDTFQVPRLFCSIYMQVRSLIWPWPFLTPRGHSDIIAFIRGVDLAQTAKNPLR
jgi:hypothetical protein